MGAVAKKRKPCVEMQPWEEQHQEQEDMEEEEGDEEDTDEDLDLVQVTAKGGRLFRAFVCFSQLRTPVTSLSASK